MPANCRRAWSSAWRRVADLVGVAAQRDGVRLVVVVGVLAGEVTERGLALHGHELLVVGDVEHRLGGVGDPPHDDRRDLDRVAAGVVDLDPLALEVANAQRELLLLGERVAPPPAGLGHRPDVSAEQDQHPRFVGLHDEESAEPEAGDHDHDDAYGDHSSVFAGGGRQRDPQRQCRDHPHRRRQAGYDPRLLLLVRLVRHRQACFQRAVGYISIRYHIHIVSPSTA